MTVEKIVVTKEKTELNILGAKLPSKEDVETLLTREEKVYKCWWWLRSPGYYSDFACYVSSYGEVSGSYVNYSDRGVRPALVLSDISDMNFKVGDIFEVAGYKFKVLSPTLAWMYEQDIGCHCFDEETNIYEESSVKKFVDEWFKTLMGEE